ncbi:hypothetical protein [Flavobacterium cerinum]|uniref:PKD domain-containing protein n=1 Tax=Flavobacterium cerinum TaxID=2502784 RepID=A0A3S3RKG5_9FLAO|nr:hypothetical protein [Flavobacterium cerinum]RWX01548.1 hypothetical protein EPI11_06245 [Flavobacterium cerinum]
MKKFKILITFVLASIMFGCSDDENSLDSLENVGAPTNVSALFTITQDNTGLVTIAPRGEGVGSYDIYFGDSTAEPSRVFPGKTINHTYAEGVYSVRVIGTTINGKTTEYIHQLTVSFREPENLAVTITPVTGDSFSIDVAAKAEFEAFFEVWFGEGENETPVQFNEGETIKHTYAAIGTYEVKVVAYSGGAATKTFTQNVTITNPLLLPINFESATLNYSLTDFGNASSSVIDNPNASGINTSTRVGKAVKNPGAETWAGTTITLDEVIDFNTFKSIRLKVWSPAAGVKVKLKIENLTDGTINHEIDQFTTVANQWEVLSYNLSAADFSKQYSKVILFFNFDVVGGGDTYYFDDIEQFSSVNPLPVTFEDDVDYNLVGFGSAVGSKVANPDASGINTSANVAKMLKPTGSETWAGVSLPLVAPIDFSVQKKLKVKVWSPAANIPVLLKLEKHNDNSVSIEKSVNTTVANEWEELTFDYTDVVNTTVPYQMVVIFFDFGTSGTGASYYYDDVKQSN